MTYKELVSPALTRFLIKLWNSDKSKPHRLGNLFLFSFVLPLRTRIQYFPLEWAVMETQRENDNKVM